MQLIVCMENNHKVVKFQPSIKGIFIVIVSLGLVALLLNLRSIVALVFGSYTVFAALNPIVEKLAGTKIGKYQIPRSLAIFIVFLLFLLIIALLIWGIVGPTLQEFISLAKDFEGLIGKILERYQLNKLLGNEALTEIQDQASKEIGQFSSSLTKSPEQILNLGRNIISGILSLVTFVAIVLYLLTSPKRARNFVVSFFPNESTGDYLMDKVEGKLGSWLRGELALMTIMSIIAYIGFVLIGIPFALPLAIITGLFDIVPIVGPTMAYVLVLIVSLSLAEPWQTLAATLLFFILQQFEATILVPKIMENSVGLDPVVVIVTLLMGSSLMGVTGAILSVPVAAVLMILYQEWQKVKKANTNKQKSEENPFAHT